MITIVNLIGLRKITVIAEPSWKDDFKNLLPQESLIPHVFCIGQRWILEHECSKCLKRLDTSEKDKNYKYIGRLSHYYIRNKHLLDSIGQLFKLDLKAEIDQNNFEIYDYSLNGMIKGIAEISYYQCPFCSAKYLISHKFLWGDDDRHPEPDKVYIEKILHVDFDHDKFMKMVMEK